MERPVGIGFHPVTKTSTFAQEIASSVARECQDATVKAMVSPRSMEALFEAARDRVISGLYESVIESCKGAVALSPNAHAAQSIIKHAEASLGSAHGSEMDYRRLGDLAVEMHSLLVSRLNSSQSSPNAEEYAATCLKKSSSLISESAQHPLTGKLYPKLARQFAKISDSLPPRKSTPLAPQTVSSSPSVTTHPSRSSEISR